MRVHFCPTSATFVCVCVNWGKQEGRKGRRRLLQLLDSASHDPEYSWVGWLGWPKDSRCELTQLWCVGGVKEEEDLSWHCRASYFK